MNPRRLLFLFLGALTFFRLVMITQIELSSDEAYYLQWAQHLDWSYYSKGPGIAATLWLGTHLFGENAFGIRCFAPFLALGTSLLMFHFARRLYGETVALWTVFTLQFIPIFQVGGLIMTIDPLSIFFWVAALYTFWLALEKAPAFNVWWPLTGALIGAGFLAKYTNAMQLLSIVLVLALTPKHRRELLRPGFFALLGVFALCTIPVLVWNSQHAWITVIHLRARGGLDSGPSFNPSEFFTYLGLHLAVYSPLLFGGLCAGLWWGWKKAGAHFKPRFLLAFTLPLFVLYFALSFKQAGEPNWTAPAMASLAILAVVFWLELARERAWAGKFAIAALALGGVMSVLILDTEMLRRLGLPLAYNEPSARLRGWQTSAEAIEAVRRKFEGETGEKVFLIAGKYGTAASLAFYFKDKRREAPGHPPIYFPESAWPDNQFYFLPRYDELVEFTQVARDLLASPKANDLDPALRTELTAALAEVPDLADERDFEKNTERRRRFLRALKIAAPDLGLDDYYTETMGYNPFLGRTALYITDRPEKRPASALERTFARSELIAVLDIHRRGQPLRQLRVFACHDYRQQEL